MCEEGPYEGFSRSLSHEGDCGKPRVFLVGVSAVSDSNFRGVYSV